MHKVHHANPAREPDEEPLVTTELTPAYIYGPKNQEDISTVVSGFVDVLARYLDLLLENRMYLFEHSSRKVRKHF